MMWSIENEFSWCTWMDMLKNYLNLFLWFDFRWIDNIVEKMSLYVSVGWLDSHLVGEGSIPYIVIPPHFSFPYSQFLKRMIIFVVIVCRKLCLKLHFFLFKICFEGSTIWYLDNF